MQVFPRWLWNWRSPRNAPGVYLAPGGKGATVPPNSTLPSCSSTAPVCGRSQSLGCSALPTHSSYQKALLTAVMMGFLGWKEAAILPFPLIFPFPSFLLQGRISPREKYEGGSMSQALLAKSSAPLFICKGGFTPFRRIKLSDWKLLPMI